MYGVFREKRENGLYICSKYRQIELLVFCVLLKSLYIKSILPELFSSTTSVMELLRNKMYILYPSQFILLGLIFVNDIRNSLSRIGIILQ